MTYVNGMKNFKANIDGFVKKVLLQDVINFLLFHSHVLEELQHQINTKKREEMTDQELQFHYFKLHDFDNNNLLDGLEIIKALTHAHDEASKLFIRLFFHCDCLLCFHTLTHHPESHSNSISIKQLVDDLAASICKCD